MCYRNYVVAHKFQTEIQRRKLKKDTTPRRVQCTEHILKLRTFSITEESLKLIGSPYVYIYKFILFIYIYRVSQEEWTKLRESVPYVELYRYNPKHIYTKLNGYGDNGQRSFRLWQLLHTYWLPNTYWNWQEYVVSVMLISVLNINLTCEWHKAIELNYKNSRTNAAVVLGFQAICISGNNEVLSYRVGRSSCAVKLANVRPSCSQMTTGRGGCIAL